MHDGMIRAHILVSGAVQGVFFRHNTYKKAISLNLTGFIRNLDNGKVEVVCQGGKENVDKLVAFCGEGVPPARVENLDVSYKQPKKEFKTFSIEY